MRVRYEALATDPAATLRAIGDFLGLAFEPAMLRYEDAEHHPLGGNTGTQSVVARAAGQLVKVPERGRSFYAPLEHGFHLDLRWREELPESVQRLFDERAGEVNEPFRWEQHGAS
jgi:hypothetical protein